MTRNDRINNMILLMKIYRYRIIYLILISILHIVVQGKDYVIDSDIDQSQNITSYIETSLTDGAFPDIFDKHNEESLHFNYTNKSIWIKIDIKNNLKYDITKVIYFTSGLVGDLRIFEKEKDRWTLKDERLINKLKDSKGFFPQFYVNIKAKDKKSYLIERKAMHHFDTKVLLSSKEYLAKKEKSYEIFYVLYIGIIVTLVFYNLVIFLFLRDKQYLIYCLFIVSISMTLLILNNFFEGFLKIPINDHLGFFSSMSILSAFLFAYNFLNLKNKYPKIRYYLFANCTTSLICMIANLTPIYANFNNLFGTLVDLNIIVSIISIMAISIKLAIKDTVARIYVLSWVFIYSGAIVWFGVYLKLIPLNFFTRHAILIGNVLEALILALALAYKINALKNKTEVLNQRAKDREKYLKLVRVLSHDMANSLFIITGFLKLYKKRPNEFQMTKVWNKIEKATSHMEDILNSVKIEQSLEKDQRVIKLEQVNLKSVLEDAIEIFENKLRDKNIEVIINYSSKTDHVRANRSILLNQIFCNLISNAIKYSHENSKIQINITDKNNKISIVIQDYGVGIPISVLDKINKNNDVFSSLGTSGEKGTGFGIYITKSYIQMLNGKFYIESIHEPTNQAQRSGTRIEVVLLAYLD